VLLLGIVASRSESEKVFQSWGLAQVFLILLFGLSELELDGQIVIVKENDLIVLLHVAWTCV